ncbi:hypothetical protein M378DRAFT_171217 [Amanita muscaria Koide BX008]|uniref:Uncharacterized protein n=1 Tax=Amanita muscaria (strain Koide BX008) TaxID=946122 RepID=A0A0C2WMG9_AMAMK|nr:hypothetical protein M378DRAFT_171217 [Amanita muscaria Koide BX008]
MSDVHLKAHAGASWHYGNIILPLFAAFLALMVFLPGMIYANSILVMLNNRMAIAGRGDAAMLLS